MPLHLLRQREMIGQLNAEVIPSDLLMEVMLEVIVYTGGDIDVCVTTHHHLALAGGEFEEVLLSSYTFGHKTAGCSLLQTLQQTVNRIGFYHEREKQ